MAAWRHGSVSVVLSEFILNELRRVLPRLSARHGLTYAEIGDLVDVLSIQAEIVAPLAGVVPDLRDANDQPVLGTFLAAQKSEGADYLITGDKDLLALADHFSIITPAKFWETHAGL